MRPSVSVPGPGVPAEQPAVPVARLGYLTPRQAAEFTNISYQELERLRRVGGGPRFAVVSSRLVRYPVDELCKWLDSFVVANASEAYERDRAAGREVARA